MLRTHGAWGDRWNAYNFLGALVGCFCCNDPTVLGVAFVLHHCKFWLVCLGASAFEFFVSWFCDPVVGKVSV